MSAKTLIIKKYANRRLYDTEKSAYVTLEAVADQVRKGRWVEVRDAKTGEDVTAMTLTQVLLEKARGKHFLFPPAVLHLMIRYGDTALEEFFQSYLEPIIENYLNTKSAVDEQFQQWLKMGMGFSDFSKNPFTGMGPLFPKPPKKPPSSE